MSTSPVRAAEVEKGRKKKKNQKKSQTAASRAGLQFPPTRVGRYMRKMGPSDAPRVGETAGVFMAAVLEYLSAEVLELAGNAARDNKRSRITPRHIQLAVRNDEELNKLFGSTMIATGGVLPNVHAALASKRPDSDGTATKTSNKKKTSKKKKTSSKKETSSKTETSNKKKVARAASQRKKKPAQNQLTAQNTVQTEEDDSDFDGSQSEGSQSEGSQSAGSQSEGSQSEGKRGKRGKGKRMTEVERLNP